MASLETRGPPCLARHAPGNWGITEWIRVTASSADKRQAAKLPWKLTACARWRLLDVNFALRGASATAFRDIAS